MKSKKMKKVKVVNGKMLIVTVDIGKSVNHGYMRAPTGQEVKPFAFHNTGHDFNKFWDNICTFRMEQGLEEVVLGFESSGPYAEPLCHFLRKKDVHLVQTNPMHTKRLKELQGNSPEKNDKKDPRVIADIIMLGHALSVIIPEGASAELRRLNQARERAVKDQTADKNRLQDRMFILFPEFLDIMRGISSKSAMHLIQNHSTPEDIVHLGEEALAAILKKVSCGKLGKERAQALFAAARNSIGIDEGKQSILMEIEHLVCKIEREEHFIKNLEKHMERYLEHIAYSHCILSIKGIGIITTAGIIGEAGDFRKYTTIKEIMKLAGLDLYEVSSGKHKGQRHISKRGRSLMRKQLYYAAVNAVKTNGIMHHQYHTMLDRGMPKTKALTAISRKLLKLIFALARNNTMYVESIDHKPKIAA